jgi:hypothetical protein
MPRTAFLDVLDGHTLADFLPRAPALVKLWRSKSALAHI